LEGGKELDIGQRKVSCSCLNTLPELLPAKVLVTALLPEPYHWLTYDEERARPGKLSTTTFERKAGPDTRGKRELTKEDQPDQFERFFGIMPADV
jgi:hypothetical protein